MNTRGGPYVSKDVWNGAIRTVAWNVDCYKVVLSRLTAGSSQENRRPL